MNWNAISFDWNQIRAFLATVEEGSMSAAARALGQTQPTLSRQITALESSLGIILCERGHRSIKVTPAGLELLEHVRAMGEAAARISLSATGQSQAIQGNVSLTASDGMSAHILPPILQKLQRQAPDIEVELIASNALSDLTRREADIAIRHLHLDRPDLIETYIGDTPVHLYASANYIKQNGFPTNLQDISHYDFVGFGSCESQIATLNSLGILLDRKNFKITTNSGLVMYELIQQGFGVGLMPARNADKIPGLVQILPDLPPLKLPIWIVTHRELYTNRRIRFVCDLLIQSLEEKEEIKK